MLTLLVLLEQRSQAQAASVQTDDNKVKLAVIGPCKRSGHKSAAVPAGISRDAEQNVVFEGLVVIDFYSKIMTEFLEQRLNCREEVSHFAVDERKLLE